MVRSAVMDIAGFSRIEDAVVWDLCSGSGAIGLEALSGGASKCIFVEKNRKAVHFIRNAIDEFGCRGRASVIQSDIRRVIPLSGDKPSLIYIDPPYDDETLYNWVAGIDWVGMLAPGGIVFLEAGYNLNISAWNNRKYGDTILFWMKRTD